MRRISVIAFIVLLVGSATAVLWFPNQVAVSVAEALQNCFNHVIPALMTFMTISSLIAYTAAGEWIVKLLARITERAFRLPAQCGLVILMSILGGYPAGAKIAASLLDRKVIDLATAEHLLCFCVNASPSYLLIAVGIGIFGDAAIGGVILAAQLISSLLIGILLRRRAPVQDKKKAVFTSLPPIRAFVCAVNDSVQAMLAITGFTITFSVILALLQSMEFFDAITAICNYFGWDSHLIEASVCGMLDVVSGIGTAAKCELETAILLCAGLVPLGGASIWCQIISMLYPRQIRVERLIRFRFLHAVLTSTMTFIIIKLTIPTATDAFLSVSSPQWNAVFSGNGIAIILLLLCCFFFLISVEETIQHPADYLRKNTIGTKCHGKKIIRKSH